MTATLIPTRTTTTAKPASRRVPLAKALAVSAVLAAAATETLTGVVRASGVDLAIDTHAANGGTPIGFGACATMIAMVLVPTVLIVAAIWRWAKQPTRAWYRLTAVLVVVSFVPDLVEPGTSAATRLTLMTAHVVAATLIVPAVGRRLR
jgi:glucan phosphoethanolaminetransferase (alkaline phosphatase superfamily)